MMKNYDNIIFRTRSAYRDPKVGSLLISQPFLDDKPFRHSVVLLTELDGNDSFSGFVLNKPSGYSLSDFVDIDDENCDMPLFAGGPVSTDHLFFIHTLSHLIDGGIHIAGDIYFGGDFNQVLSYINSGFAFHSRLRFFLGYSGWGNHQLIEEIKEQFWAVKPEFDTPDIFTGSGDAFWHRQVRQLGNDFKSWRYHPMNPQAN